MVRDVHWKGPLGFHEATDSAPFLRVPRDLKERVPKPTTFIQAAYYALNFGTKLYFQREYFNKFFLQVLTFVTEAFQLKILNYMLTKYLFRS